MSACMAQLHCSRIYQYHPTNNVEVSFKLSFCDYCMYVWSMLKHILIRWSALTKKKIPFEL